MTPREANVLWLRDMLEHLVATQQQLEWAEDQEAVRLVTDNMLRDLERCQRLVETMRKRCGIRQPA